jgi:soluble lytic murein transglycosylase-like protein
MKIDVWILRTPARHHLRLMAVASLVLALVPLLGAQQLRPTSENGRIVWTNDAAPLPAEPSSAHDSYAARPAKQWVYWSNTEHRYKVIRRATPNAIRSARAVAGEVSNYIESRPLLNSSPARNKDGGKDELAAQDPNYSRVAVNRSVDAAEIDRYIDEAAARHHVDPNLVRALIKVESNFNPRARSTKGAMGLMQLMPDTARMYDVRNPFDAAQNVDAGVRHLKGLLENYGGDVSLSLAAYNAGQGAVERNGGIPPFAETRNYVQRITRLMGGGSEMHLSSLSMPIHIHRDERGVLVITNTD